MVFLHQFAVSFGMTFSDELNYLSVVDGYFLVYTSVLLGFRRRGVQKVFHYTCFGQKNRPGQ